MAKLTFKPVRARRRGDMLSTVVIFVVLAFSITLGTQVQAHSQTPVAAEDIDCAAFVPADGQSDAPVVGSRGLRQSGESRCRKESLSALRVLGIWAVFTR